MNKVSCWNAPYNELMESINNSFKKNGCLSGVSLNITFIVGCVSNEDALNIFAEDERFCILWKDNNSEIIWNFSFLCKQEEVILKIKNIIKQKETIIAYDYGRIKSREKEVNEFNEKIKEKLSFAEKLFNETRYTLKQFDLTEKEIETIKIYSEIGKNEYFCV